MCFHQKIHTAHHALLLAFDAAAQQHHVCELSYPSDTSDGIPGEKCTEHSCCRVTYELIFKCVAVKEGGACVGNDGGEGNGEYVEEVYVPFAEGGEPVWITKGGVGSKGEAKKKVNEKKWGWEWHWSSPKSRGGEDVLWDAFVEGAFPFDHDKDDSETDSDTTITTSGDSSTSLGSSSPPQKDIFHISGDWEDEHGEEAEIPRMEFWSFDHHRPVLSSSSSPSYSSSGDDGAEDKTEEEEEEEGLPLPCGKSIVYLEDENDVVDLGLDESQIVGTLDPGAVFDFGVGVGADGSVGGGDVGSVGRVDHVGGWGRGRGRGWSTR